MSIKGRILIAEKTCGGGENLHTNLNRLGYDIIGITSSGQEAIEQATHQKPDIVFMDISLKGEVNGREAGRQISDNLGIPIIYLTNKTDSEILVRTENANPHGYLLKPIESSELQSTIEITLLKHSLEKKYREQKQLMSIALSGVNDAVIIIDLQERLVFLNPAAEDILNIRANEAIGQNLHDIFQLYSVEHETGSKQHITTLIDGAQIISLPQILSLTTNQGKQILVNALLTPITDDDDDTLGGAVLTTRNMTENTKNDKELHYQLRFEEMVTDLSARYIDIGGDAIDEEIKQTLRQIGMFTGIDRAYICLINDEGADDKKQYEWCAPGIQSKRKIMREINANHPEWIINKITNCTVVHIPKVSQLPPEADNKRKILEQMGIKSLLCIPIGKGKHIIGMLSLDSIRQEKNWSGSDIKILQIVGDIFGAAFTRLQMEKDLRETKERFRSIAEMAPDAIFETDKDGYITFINRRGFEYFGYLEEEFYTGFNVLNLIAPSEKERAQKYLSNVLSDNQGHMMEFLAIRKNGSTFYANFHTETIIRQGEVCALEGIIVDITERKKRELEYLKNQKLESIGVLAGGIAHDFNNILTAILGNISLAKMEVSSQDELHEILTDAETASLRARDLIQQLLTFSEGGAPVKRTSSIARIIKDSAEFCLRGSNVRCEFSFPDDLYHVQIDQTQMSQVINNIIINANQAMPTGGRIFVTVKNSIISDDKPTLSLPPGAYIQIAIRDQGTGIPRADIGRVFDPFFTTKEQSSGLGLAIAFSIVKRHGGTIDVESQPAIGSTFSIYLPAVKNDETTFNQKQTTIQTTQTGRILIMDDEAAVRKMAGRVLERLGYKVAYASDGQEAIQLYKNAQKKHMPYDLIIMDLTIPGGMGGTEALKEIRKLDPQSRAIVSSGYSNDPVMADFSSYGFQGCVAKPYRPKQLATAINEALGKNST